MDQVQNADLLPSRFAGSMQGYVQHMRRSSSWGGGLEIRALSQVLGVRVRVMNIRDGDGDGGGAERSSSGICFDVDGAQTEIRISWNGGHYEYLDHRTGTGDDDGTGTRG